MLGVVSSCLLGLFVFQSLGVGAVLLFLEEDLTSFLGSQDHTEPLRNELRRAWLFIGGMSSLGAFVVAPFVYLRYVSSSELLRHLSLQWPGAMTLLLCLLIVLSFMGVNAWLIDWNQSWQLPEILSGLEQWMKEREDWAARITEQFMQMPTVWDFLCTLIVVAVIAAVGEEFLFRGILQTHLQALFRSSHASIWTAALLFSFFHLQFYGFVPRLLLGALFGYLYAFSGKLWVPILAHFVNNGSVVLASYMKQEEIVGATTKDIETPPIWASIGALLLTAGLLYLFFQLQKKSQRQAASNWVEVYFTPNLHRAGMLRGLLEQQGISAVVLDKKDSAFRWGGYGVYVSSSVAEAKAFVDENFSIS